MIRQQLATAFRFARRELRAGLAGFYVFIACIALSIATMTAVGTVGQSLEFGIESQGQSLLGGDISVRVNNVDIDKNQYEVLSELGKVNRMVKMRTSARSLGEEPISTLVYLKAVRDTYPNVGIFKVLGGGNLHELIGQNNNTWGIVVAQDLLGRLNLRVGDEIDIGRGRFMIRGVIEREPDQAQTAFQFAPHVLISQEALDGTGLIRQGSLVDYEYQILLNDQNIDSEDLSRLDARLSKMSEEGEWRWRVRTRDNASPSMNASINRFSQFLTFVGMAILIVGGVGVANAVNAFVSRQVKVTAILVSVGASHRFAIWVQLIHIALITLVATVLGVLVGMGVAFGFGNFLASILGIDAEVAFFWQPVLLASGFGVLTAFAFSIPGLSRTEFVSPTALFRDRVQPLPNKIARWAQVVRLLAFGALVFLIWLTAYDKMIAFYAVLGTIVVFNFLQLAGWLVVKATRAIPTPNSLQVRWALKNIYRPDSRTPAIVLSFGLGLTLLVALSQIQGNLSAQISDRLPEDVPSFFFVDVQKEEREAFVDLLEELAPDGVINQVPLLRGQVKAIKGQSVRSMDIPVEAQWVVRGDRGITFSDILPKGSTLAEGEWWPVDYQGKNLVSVELEAALDLGLSIGDEITFSILGREIKAEIANFRSLAWESLGINFVFVFSPNTFASAPYNVLCTLSVPFENVESERRLLGELTRKFPAVSAVNVRDTLAIVNDLIDQLANAISVAASITMISSILVLSGALSAGYSRRVYDAIVLKVMGATRRRLLMSYLYEFVILGGIGAVFAIVVGVVVAWLLVSQVMGLEFSIMAPSALIAAVAAVTLTVVLGLLNTLWALFEKPARLLRSL